VQEPIVDAGLAATIECRLITTGRTSGEPREIRIWFSSNGDRVFLLSQDQERAHWVRNIVADPQVTLHIGQRAFSGVARVLDRSDPDDALARDTFAAKYGTKYLGKFLRDALPVAIDLGREIG
jgi:deazaflavin-dependent oxidoreductase (nitroreductase family)